MIGIIISILFFNISGESSSELDSYLNMKLADYKKYEYEIVSLPSIVKSINDDRISISSDREFKINYGYAYIPVEIKGSGENTMQSVVTIKMNLFNEVFVANKKIRKGDVITASDFSFVEEEVTHLRNATVKNITEFNNHQAAMNIADGAILQDNMIVTQPDIKAGNKIYAFSTVGSVTVSFPAYAREDGRIGETVRIVRDDKLTFKALIVNSQQVKIIE